MKKLVLSTAMVVGLAASVLAQGTILFDSSANTGAAANATVNGQWWDNFTSPGNPVLLSQDVNAQLLAGTSAGSLTPIATLLLSNNSATGDITAFAPQNGSFIDNSTTVYSVPGTTVSGTAFFEVLAWVGPFSSYAAAVAGGAAHGDSGVFSNPTGGPNPPNPTVPAPGLPNMPAVVLSVPEPGTIALAGLGLASLLVIRRRK